MNIEYEMHAAGKRHICLCAVRIQSPFITHVMSRTTLATINNDSEMQNGEIAFARTKQKNLNAVRPATRCGHLRPRIVSERRSIAIVNGLLLGKDMVDPHRVSEFHRIQSRSRYQEHLPSGALLIIIPLMWVVGSIKPSLN